MLEYWLFSLVSPKFPAASVVGSPSNTFPPPLLFVFLMSYKCRPRAPAYWSEIRVFGANCCSRAASQNCVCAVLMFSSTLRRPVGGNGTAPAAPPSGPELELVMVVLLMTTTP